jgi:hypothetical protein
MAGSIGVISCCCSLRNLWVLQYGSPPFRISPPDTNRPFGAKGPRPTASFVVTRDSRLASLPSEPFTHSTMPG